MTIAKDFASKATIAFVALAMIFTMSVPASNAQQTPEDLQKMIDALMAQIETLKAGGSSATASGYTWTRDLKTGATGADVMELQKFLNSDADTRVAATGAGSAGMETSYFGPATAAAVSKFQLKYRSDILSPAGLVNPTGFFGPSTRAKANAMNTVTVPPVVDENDNEGPTDEDDDKVTLSGAADLDSFEIEDADDTDVEEGDEDVEIGKFLVTFNNGDAEISRIDITLDSTTSVRPSKAFENVTLWVDGDKIATAEASSKSDYLGSESAGKLRFSDLKLVAMEDEEVEITVAATIKDNLDTAEKGNWTLEVPSFRYFDADGVALTEDDPSDGDNTVFNIETAGANEELKFSLSSNNPDSMDIVVDETTVTKDQTILEYKLAAKDNDIELTTLATQLTGTVGTSLGNLISRVRMEVDGKLFTSEAALLAGSLTSTSSPTALYAFDIDGDVVVGAGDTITVKVIVDFKRQDTNYANGTQITASASTTATVAEGADDLVASQLKGSANGKAQTLVASGVTLDAGAMSAVSKNNDTVASSSYGEYKIAFDVTAIEETAFVQLTSGRATTTAGVSYVVEDANGTIVTTGVTTQSLTRKSGGTVSGGFVEIASGESATFELVVTFDPAASGQYRVQLQNVGFAATAVGATDNASAIPAEDYETSNTLVNN